jgi:hypothetical protein
MLWRLRDRLSPPGLFGAFAVFMGLSRVTVEFVRLNDEVVAGLTQPQLWSLALAALGATLLARERWPQIGLREPNVLSATGESGRSSGRTRTASGAATTTSAGRARPTGRRRRSATTVTAAMATNTTATPTVG